jgi:hypothetical protein
MSKLLFDWLQQKLEQFPLMTILLAVALVWQELSSQRQITIELLQNIDRRLSHIEGRLSK